MFDKTQPLLHNGCKKEAFFMTTLFEQQSGTYSMVEDYNIPDLCVPGKECPYGKYGRMRLDFLKRHRRALYVNLLTSGKLHEHLWDIDWRCIEQVEQLVVAYAQTEGTDEALKARDQMKWVGLMNNYRKVVEEVVLGEMVTG
jgi:hypothetical protein